LGDQAAPAPPTVIPDFAQQTSGIHHGHARSGKNTWFGLCWRCRIKNQRKGVSPVRFTQLKQPEGGKMSVSILSPFRTFTVLLTLPVLSLAFASQAQAAIYLKIDGIKGEVAEKSHKEWILIESMSSPSLNDAIRNAPRQETSATTMATTDGQTTSKRQHRPITITKELDKSTPLLKKAAQDGRIIKQAMLEMTDPNDPAQMIRIKLENVLVSFLQTSDAAGSSASPKEEFSLNYEKIYITRLPMTSPSR